LRVKEIIEAIAHIEDFTRGLKLSDFRKDIRTQHAAMRDLQGIGESARHVPEAIRKQHAHIPRRKMIGLRNILVHEYFGTNVRIIWRTATRNVPPLKPVLRAMLETESQGAGLKTAAPRGRKRF
jgi:uncharacterized protein with HEPN domain